MGATDVLARLPLRALWYSPDLTETQQKRRWKPKASIGVEVVTNSSASWTAGHVRFLEPDRLRSPYWRQSPFFRPFPGATPHHMEGFCPWSIPSLQAMT
jgi:hypothetical protein